MVIPNKLVSDRVFSTILGLYLLGFFVFIAVENKEEQISPSANASGSKNVEIRKSKSADDTPSQVINDKPAPSSSADLPTLQEPDVIASTKNSNNFPSFNEPFSEPPVAPPRRKKKLKEKMQALVKSTSSSTSTLCKVSIKYFLVFHFFGLL